VRITCDLAFLGRAPGPGLNKLREPWNAGSLAAWPSLIHFVAPLFTILRIHLPDNITRCRNAYNFWTFYITYSTSDTHPYQGPVRHNMAVSNAPAAPGTAWDESQCKAGLAQLERLQEQVRSSLSLYYSAV
jgi:hypothetical protein